jgi:hypothetical protein
VELGKASFIGDDPDIDIIKVIFVNKELGANDPAVQVCLGMGCRCLYAINIISIFDSDVARSTI